MNKFAPVLLVLSWVFITETHAANPNPKPNCPLGQIAVLDGDYCECKQPGITSDTRPRFAGASSRTQSA